MQPQMNSLSMGCSLDAPFSKTLEELGIPLKDINEPSDADVLCGRGGAALRHPGNQTYRRLVNLNKALYITCLKTEKLKISRSIVAAIREQRGRFLEKDSKAGSWFDIGDKKAIEKTSQALREGQPKLRQQIVEMGVPPVGTAALGLAADPQFAPHLQHRGAVAAAAAATAAGMGMGMYRSDLAALAASDPTAVLLRHHHEIPHPAMQGHHHSAAVQAAAAAAVRQQELQHAMAAHQQHQADLQHQALHLEMMKRISLQDSANSPAIMAAAAAEDARSAALLQQRAAANRIRRSAPPNMLHPGMMAGDAPVSSVPPYSSMYGEAAAPMGQAPRMSHSPVGSLMRPPMDGGGNMEASHAAAREEAEAAAAATAAYNSRGSRTERQAQNTPSPPPSSSNPKVRSPHQDDHASGSYRSPHQDDNASGYRSPHQDNNTSGPYRSPHQDDDTSGPYSANNNKRTATDDIDAAAPAPAQPFPSAPASAQPFPSTPAPAQPFPSTPAPAQPYPSTPAPAQPYPSTPAPAQPFPSQENQQLLNNSNSRHQKSNHHAAHSGASGALDRRRVFGMMKFDKPSSGAALKRGAGEAGESSHRSLDDLGDFHMVESQLSLYSNMSEMTGAKTALGDGGSSHNKLPMDGGFKVEKAKVVDHSRMGLDNGSSHRGGCAFPDALGPGSRHSIMSGLSRISDTSVDHSIFSDLSRKIGNVSTRSIAMSEISAIDMQEREDEDDSSGEFAGDRVIATPAVNQVPRNQQQGDFDVDMST